MKKYCVISLLCISCALNAQTLLDALHQKVQISRMMRESARTHEKELNQLLGSLQKSDAEWVEKKKKELQELIWRKNGAPSSASPETVLYQELQDYIQTFSRFADEAQKNFSSFAANYGFVNSDGSINTQAISDSLKTIEQEITQKSSSLAQKKEEIAQQAALHATTIKNAIERYLKTITPVKQIVTSPLDQTLKKLAGMSSSTESIDLIAKEQGFANPDGSIKTQQFLDALSKMEKEALEFATKISPEKKNEVQKIIEPQVGALRKKLEEYKAAHPEKEAASTVKEPAPMAATTGASETSTPSAATEQPTVPSETPPPAAEQSQASESPPTPEPSSLESEPSLQPAELPGV